MKTKTAVLLVIILAIIIAVLTIVVANKDSSPVTTQSQVPLENSGTANVIPENATGEYTLREVSLHGNTDSCWTIIRGNVYDLTGWIRQHPGGSQAILGLCGRDGTATFEGQHGGTPNPEKALAGFMIGTYKK